MSVLMPDINKKAPLSVHSFEDFSKTMEQIEEWSSLAKDTSKRFGVSNTLCELSCAIRKTTVKRRANSPYIRNILKTTPRYFKLGRILPKKLGGIIFIDGLIKDEFFNF